MTPGTQLGSYEILSPLGKGGMGEVWKAKDTKLGREVAIKTLPEEFARDEERLARFEREAKLLASLNHPNIAAIYGLEEDNGTRFLVLELVEGDTLADRLKRGAIPVEESLKLALQIAEALEAAHEKGVIHRDLKPANIKVTPDGKVKVLDFGLAKAFVGDGADANLSNSPTLSMAATQQGVILGTAAYMSPEQARGESTDKRADIWAFGVVLFEMLSGQGTFDGRTVSDVLAGVLAKEPQWNTLPINLHPRIRLLLERCLEKEARDRYHDIADVRVDIRKVLSIPGGVLAQPVAEGQAVPRSSVSWIAVTAILSMAFAGAAAWTLKPQPSVPMIRTVIPLPAGEGFPTSTGAGCSAAPLALSPDGSVLAYVANNQLYVRRMNDYQATALAGTSSARGPFFSPDGQWIGFFQNNQLKKVTVSGGTPLSISQGTCFGHWAEDDTIVFNARSNIGGLARISAAGGVPERLTVFADGETRHLMGQALPGGQALLFTAGSTVAETRQIVVQTLSSGERPVTFAGSHARYVPTGHLVYATPQAPTLMAVPFDVERLELTGTPVPVVEGVTLGPSQRVAYFSVSDSGTLAYVPGGLQAIGEQNLVWVDAQGTIEPVGTAPGVYEHPRLSPDGNWVALTIREDSGLKPEVWLYEVRRPVFSKLTFNGGEQPVWTPDSRSLIYTSIRDGVRQLFRKAANRSGEEEPVGSDSTDRVAGSISPQGVLAFEQQSSGFRWDLVTVSLGDEESLSRFFEHQRVSMRRRSHRTEGGLPTYRESLAGMNEVLPKIRTGC